MKSALTLQEKENEEEKVKEEVKERIQELSDGCVIREILRTEKMFKYISLSIEMQIKAKRGSAMQCN